MELHVFWSESDVFFDCIVFRKPISVSAVIDVAVVEHWLDRRD